MSSTGRDKFRVKIVESSSPLTKRPSTPFRLAALGILEQKYCYEREYTKPFETDFKNPSELPVVPDPKKAKCDIVLATKEYDVDLNVPFEIQLTHGVNENFFSGIEGGVALGYKTYVENGKIMAVIDREGTYSITFTVKYSNCLSCTVTIVATAEKVVIPPEPVPACEIDLGNKTYPSDVEGVNIFLPVDQQADVATFDIISSNPSVFTMERVDQWTFNAVAMGSGTTILTVNMTFNDSTKCTRNFTWIIEGEVVDPEPPVDPEPTPEPPPVIPGVNNMQCGNKIETDNGNRIMSYQVTSKSPNGEYTLSFNAYSIEDDIYVFAGNPKEGGQMLGSIKRAYRDQRSPVHFTYTGDEYIFVQFNTEQSADENTGFEFMVTCGELQGTPIPKELPHPYGGS